MCCFNAEKFLSEAIDSILAQTLTDWELIAVDDGSTDGTYSLLEGYEDPRIRVVRLDQNQGIPRALNCGLKLVTGDLIARLDADDVADPDRLRVQAEFLDKHLEVVLVGGWLRTRGEAASRVLGTKSKGNLGPILLRGNQLLNSSVMFRESIVRTNNIRYREDLTNAQDYEFWLQLSQFGEIRLIGDVLGSYLMHPDQQTTRFGLRQRRLGLKVQFRALRGGYEIVGVRSWDFFVGIVYFMRHAIGLIGVISRMR